MSKNQWISLPFKNLVVLLRPLIISDEAFIVLLTLLLKQKTT